MARLTYLTVAVVVATALSTPAAQTNREVGSKSHVVTGTVTAVSATAIVIGRSGVAMMFNVDSSTRLTGRGAKARDLLNRKRTIHDYVKVGDTVRITYRQSGNALTAVEVRVAPR